jgi:hypothetical protein
MLPQTQDYPGICSANLFAQSAYKNICDKRTPEVQSCIEAAQRNPQILYFSDLHPILNSIRTLGQVNVDGIVKTPTSVID